MKTQVYLIPFTRSMPVSFSREALSMEYADILKGYNMLVSDDEYRGIQYHVKKDNVLAMEFYHLIGNKWTSAFLILKRLSDSGFKDVEIVYYRPKDYDLDSDEEYNLFKFIKAYSENSGDVDVNVDIRILEIED